MAANGLSARALLLQKQGPFPGRVDPWAEDARYFQMIHSGMISALLSTMQDPLAQLGYFAGRETSLQILEGREPDIFVRTERAESSDVSRLNYELAAAEVLAEPGIAVYEEPALEAIHIRASEGNLVTVIEIISPRNKHVSSDLRDYKERRSRLCLERGIHVVEIDITRSVKRLVAQDFTRQSPYHAAVFLPGEDVRIIEMRFADVLKRITVPLRREVLPVELQQAYETAYSENRVALHLLQDERYTEAHLPFPTLLSDEQRADALERVARWREALHDASHG